LRDFSTKKRKTNIKALRQRNKFITPLHKSAFCKIFKIFLKNKKAKRKGEEEEEEEEEEEKEI